MKILEKVDRGTTILLKGCASMSSAYTLKITAEKAKEVPMVDLAFEILKSANTTFYYRDLMQEIAKIKELSEEEMMQVIAQLYTEINIDGRFACVGGNMWGLKRWYPIEKGDDNVTGGGSRPRIINDDFEEEDEDIFAEEEEEESYSGEEEDYDSFDDDADFVEEEEEEEEFFDEEADEELEDTDEELAEDESEEEADDFEFADDGDDEDDK
jgi:DNA-directed RNA polymerase subunit delta